MMDSVEKSCFFNHKKQHEQVKISSTKWEETVYPTEKGLYYQDITTHVGVMGQVTRAAS